MLKRYVELWISSNFTESFEFQRWWWVMINIKRNTWKRGSNRVHLCKERRRRPFGRISWKKWRKAVADDSTVPQHGRYGIEKASGASARLLLLVLIQLHWPPSPANVFIPTSPSLIERRLFHAASFSFYCLAGSIWTDERKKNPQHGWNSIRNAEIQHPWPLLSYWSYLISTAWISTLMDLHRWNLTTSRNNSFKSKSIQIS